jgi:hypothetical protein
VATAQSIRCLVGPDINGWIAVYPEKWARSGLHAFAEPHVIEELGLSPDGEALLVVRRPAPRGRTNLKEMTSWQLWSYRKLVEEEISSSSAVGPG